VIEEGLVDRGAGDAVLDVHVHHELAHGQRPVLLRPLVACDEVAATHRRLGRIIELRQCVVGPRERMREPLAEVLARGVGGHESSVLSGAQRCLAVVVFEPHRAAHDRGVDGVSDPTHREARTEGDGATVVGVHDERIVSGGHVDEHFAVHETDRPRADALDRGVAPQDHRGTIRQGDATGRSVFVGNALERGATLVVGAVLARQRAQSEGEQDRGRHRDHGRNGDRRRSARG